MENGASENNLCLSESVNGTLDVWSCKASDNDTSSADHLVVMVHGILGRKGIQFHLIWIGTDWKFAAEQFVKVLPDKVFVHCSETNISMLTLDGVDVMGERLAKEVLELIQRKPRLQKISFIAHSVGGLVARYAIGRLYRSIKTEKAEDTFFTKHVEGSSGTICGLEAVNFITVATPHLGSRGRKQVPFLFGIRAFEKAATLVIHLIFRRTGQHLFLTDDDEGKPPLLKRMIEDSDESYFMYVIHRSALHLFKRRVVYSNVGYDHIVGWRTSSIRRDCELPKWEDTLDENYPHVVYEEHCKAINVEKDKPVSIEIENDDSDMLEEELVSGLSRVSWEKVDVSFHSSRQRFAAHSVIQVKDQSMHFEGADVIRHMIDHFVT